MPTQCHGFGFLNYKIGDFPNAEYIGNNGLHIGVHQDIGEEEMQYIMDTLANFLEKHT
jgi:dTDP-4-amino-4,6-dideoxygalactose transaminase